MPDLVEKHLGSVHLSLTESAGVLKISVSGSLVGGALAIEGTISANSEQLLDAEAAKIQSPSVQKVVQFLAGLAAKLPA